MEEQDLLEILGHKVDMTNYCGSRGTYLIWEDEIAIPLLQSKGYTFFNAYSIEKDSFGPLIRGFRVMNPDGINQVLAYG